VHEARGSRLTPRGNDARRLLISAIRALHWSRGRPRRVHSHQTLTIPGLRDRSPRPVSATTLPSSSKTKRSASSAAPRPSRCVASKDSGRGTLHQFPRPGVKHQVTQIRQGSVESRQASQRLVLRRLMRDARAPADARQLPSADRQLPPWSGSSRRKGPGVGLRRPTGKGSGTTCAAPSALSDRRTHSPGGEGGWVLA
jgi:hypothetical protein